MRSIRRVLLKELLGVLIALEVLGGVVTCLLTRHESYERFDDALDAKALAVSTLTFWDGGRVKEVFSDRYFRGFDDKGSRDYFEIWDGAGNVLAKSESVVAGDLPQRFGTAVKPARWDADFAGHEVRLEGFRFHPKSATGPWNTKTPECLLVVASHRGGLQETVWELSTLTVASTLVLAIATLVTVPRVLNRGLAPVRKLAEEMTNIHADSLGERIETGTLPSELQPIAGRLNELLGRLQESFERERRFNADLAHELRTPIAELRSAAECALKWPETRTSEADKDVLAIATQMESLVTHMLQLARGESGQLSVTVVTIDLRTEVEAIWRSLAERAGGKAVQARFLFGSGGVDGDLVLARSILTNLLDNAVEHGAAPGAIEVKTWADGGATRLSVGNAAPDLEKADVPKLFDRFWRKEEARSNGRHAGLGLALSKELAGAMGWSLEARLSPEHWLELVLTMPSART